MGKRRRRKGRRGRSGDDAAALRRARRLAADIIGLAVADGGADPWLVPDDGLTVDPVAVYLAALGRRRVPLTHTERIEAGARIIIAHGTLDDLCRRLSLPITVTGAEWTKETPVQAMRSLLGCDP
jgi:hypothetical protein